MGFAFSALVGENSCALSTAAIRRGMRVDNSNAQEEALRARAQAEYAKLREQMRRQDATTAQLSQQINEVADRGMGKEERVYLPGTLEGSKEDLLALLQQAHQFYGAPGRV